MADEPKNLQEKEETTNPPGEIPWDPYALEAVEKHARELKAKCVEITRRCKLPSVTDYTVGMALRELMREKAGDNP